MTTKEAYSEAVGRLVAWRSESERQAKADAPMVKWYAIRLKHDDIYEECLLLLRAYYGVWP